MRAQMGMMQQMQQMHMAQMSSMMMQQQLSMGRAPSGGMGMVTAPRGVAVAAARAQWRGVTLTARPPDAPRSSSAQPMLGGLGMGAGGMSSGMPLHAGMGGGMGSGVGMMSAAPQGQGGGDGFAFLKDGPADAFAFVGEELGKNKTKL